MNLSNYTELQQQNFSSYCKSGILNPVEGLTPGRINHYRRLVYNNIDDAMRSAFPLTENLISNAEWDYLVDLFISGNNHNTPFIWRLPFEFYSFIESENIYLKEKYPFLTELLYFEWKEVELFLIEDKSPPLFTKDGLIESDILIISPEYEIMQFNYPVHIKTADTISDIDKGNYFVLMFRAFDKVNFMDISPLLASAVTTAAKVETSLQQLAFEASTEFEQIDYKTFLSNFVSFFTTLQKKGFLLGFKNENTQC